MEYYALFSAMFCLNFMLLYDLACKLPTTVSAFDIWPFSSSIDADWRVNILSKDIQTPVQAASGSKSNLLNL